MKLEYNKSALQRSNRLAVRTKEKLQTASPIPYFLTKDMRNSSWTFTAHTTYSRNIMSLKFEGIYVLWVLNEIVSKKYPEKKIA